AGHRRSRIPRAASRQRPFEQRTWHSGYPRAAIEVHVSCAASKDLNGFLDYLIADKRMNALARHDINTATDDLGREFADFHELKKSEALRIVVIKQVHVGLLVLLPPRHG